jgi:uncharacterized protein
MITSRAVETKHKRSSTLELQHSFTVPADVEAAWAALLDLETVAPCFPGATLTGRDGDDFSGQVRVKLGPVSLQYAGKGRFVERDDAAHRAVIEAQGRDKRGNGTAGATVVAQLEAEGEGATRVVVDTQLKVTGRPAQFGRGVMQDVGGRIIDQFADNLARQLGGGSAEAPAAEAPAAETSAAETSETEAPAVEAPAAPVEEAASTESAAATEPPSPPPSSTAGTTAAPTSFADRTGSTATRPPAPRPDPVRPSGDGGSSSGGQQELDLNAVVLPALARQYRSALVTVLVTAIVTWWAARRRYRH